MFDKIAWENNGTQQEKKASVRIITVYSRVGQKIMHLILEAGNLNALG